MAASDANESISESIRVAVKGADLPERKYFKIGEVAQIVGVEPHVLRYWQTQFPQVRPQKSRSGHRLYKRRDVETLLGIRELLHVQRFTIAGAKQALRSLRSPKAGKPGTKGPVAKAQVKAVGRSASSNGTSSKGAIKEKAIAMPVEAVDIVALEGEELQNALDEQVAKAQGEQTKVWVHSNEADDDENQLDFAFDDSALAKLENAKSELLGLLEVLDSPRV